jgi:hypothetical protein
MFDVEDAAKYPLRGDDATRTLAVAAGIPALVNVVWSVIGLLGAFLPPLLLLYLPLLPVQLAISVLWTGYFVRVARRTFAGEDTPPALGDWRELAADGFWGTVVVVAYQVPLFVVTVAGYGALVVVLAGSSGLAEGGAEGAAAGVGVVGALAVVALSLFALAYSLAISYVLPAALLAYADEGRVGAAFSVDRLRTVTLSEAYAIPWVVAATAYVGVVMVVTTLTAVLVGFLLVPLLPVFYFYLGSATFYALALAYAEETGDAGPAAPAVESGATVDRGPEDV